MSIYPLVTVFNYRVLPLLWMPEFESRGLNAEDAGTASLYMKIGTNSGTLILKAKELPMGDVFKLMDEVENRIQKFIWDLI